jgi:uncharacterized protein (TIGR03067 family)
MVSMTTDPIEGTWLPSKAELAGDVAPDMALAKICLVIHAGTYAVHFGHEVSDSGSYTLGALAEIQTIVLTSFSGPNAGRTIPSIYQLVGDRLRICYGLDGTTPTEFAAPAGSPHYLVSYKRKARASARHADSAGNREPHASRYLVERRQHFFDCLRGVIRIRRDKADLDRNLIAEKPARGSRQHDALWRPPNRNSADDHNATHRLRLDQHRIFTRREFRRALRRSRRRFLRGRSRRFQSLSAMRRSRTGCE